MVTTPSDTPSCTDECDGAAIYLSDDAEITPIGERAIINAFAQRRGAQAVYGDVEIAGTTTRRPAWSPTRLLSEPAACLPLAVRCSTLTRIGCAISDPALPLRLAEARAVVLHVPAVLSRHSRAPEGADTAEINGHLAEIGIEATAVEDGTANRLRLVPEPRRPLPVSIVIPTAGETLGGDQGDGGELAVERCLATIAGDARPNLEVLLIVGDEYQGDPEDVDTSRLPVRLLRRPPGPFNFSSACNQGILAARTELVLLLNDDIELDSGAIDAMAVHLGDSSIGAVGAMLRYPDGTVQHAGMIMDNGHPLHPFLGWRPEESKPHGGTVARDLIAVTGACLMSRRSLMLTMGGLSTVFPLSFNDVDLCLKIRRSGFRVIIEPGATAVHRESLSRKARIFDWEWDRWIDRWGEVADPWYHPDYYRPDDALRLHLNADHLEPLERRDHLEPRDTALIPVAYHARPHHASDDEAQSPKLVHEGTASADSRSAQVYPRKGT